MPYTVVPCLINPDPYFDILVSIHLYYCSTDRICPVLTLIYSMLVYPPIMSPRGPGNESRERYISLLQGSPAAFASLSLSATVNTVLICPNRNMPTMLLRTHGRNRAYHMFVAILQSWHFPCLSQTGTCRCTNGHSRHNKHMMAFPFSVL